MFQTTMSEMQKFKHKQHKSPFFYTKVHPDKDPHETLCMSSMKGQSHVMGSVIRATRTAINTAFIAPLIELSLTDRVVMCIVDTMTC